MKLIILQVNGENFNVATNTAADLDGADAWVKFSDTVPSGWVEITDLQEVLDYSKYIDRDYKYIRDKIKELVIAKGTNEEDGFNNLTAQEKVIACEYKIGTHAQRLAVVGIDNLILLGLQYHAKVSEARTTRLAYAIAEVHNRLPNNGEEVIDDTNAENLVFQYVYFGREGVDEGDTLGIMDYVFGRSGTSYDGAGLLQKAWTPEAETMADLCDTIKEILIYGNY